MFPLVVDLATLYVELVIYESYPTVVLSIVCICLFVTYGAAYLRRLRFIRYFERIKNGDMDCMYTHRFAFPPFTS